MVALGICGSTIANAATTRTKTGLRPQASQLPEMNSTIAGMVRPPGLGSAASWDLGSLLSCRLGCSWAGKPVDPSQWQQGGEGLLCCGSWGVCSCKARWRNISLFSCREMYLGRAQEAGWGSLLCKWASCMTEVFSSQLW